MNIDFTKSPQQIVVTMINNDNGSRLTPESLIFGIPQIVDATTAAAKHYNTSLLITGKEGTRYAGTDRVVYYNRIEFSSINDVHKVFFSPAGLTNISDLLPLINAEYKVSITPSDIIDGPVPEFTGTDPLLRLPVVIVAAAESLLFKGIATFLLERPSIALADIITNQFLTDLTYQY